MKDLKDYIHLYLGCQCILTDDDGEERKFIMNAYNLNYYRDYLLSIKPILRPLSDMTDREVLDVVSIVLRKEIDFLQVEWTPERDYVLVKYGEWLPEGDYEKEIWEKCELNIAINDDFTIYNHANYIKGNGTGVGNQPLYKQHEATKYLLSRGFDLFGLIPAGLAIDKKTINL